MFPACRELATYKATPHVSAIPNVSPHSLRADHVSLHFGYIRDAHFSASLNESDSDRRDTCSVNYRYGYILAKNQETLRIVSAGCDATWQIMRTSDRPASDRPVFPFFLVRRLRSLWILCVALRKPARNSYVNATKHVGVFASFPHVFWEWPHEALQKAAGNRVEFSPRLAVEPVSG